MPSTHSSTPRSWVKVTSQSGGGRDEWTSSPRTTSWSRSISACTGVSLWVSRFYLKMHKIIHLKLALVSCCEYLIPSQDPSWHAVVSHCEYLILSQDLKILVWASLFYNPGWKLFNILIIEWDVLQIVADFVCLLIVINNYIIIISFIIRWSTSKRRWFDTSILWEGIMWAVWMPSSKWLIVLIYLMNFYVLR